VIHTYQVCRVSFSSSLATLTDKIRSTYAHATSIMGRTTTRSSSRKVNTPYNRPPARYPAGTSTFFPYATAASVHRIHTHSSLRIAFSVLPGSTTETLGYAIRTELMVSVTAILIHPTLFAL
jgi:hypothetical protein